MFELEAGTSWKEQAPFGPWAQNLEHALGTRIKRRSLTVWQEHCSECAMPDCYSSCSFYAPRRDYKCRRFTGGVDLFPGPSHASFGMLVRFGRWARLLGYGPTPLRDVPSVARLEARTRRLAQHLDRAPMLRGMMAPVRRRLVNRRLRTEAWGSQSLQNLFLVVEVANGGDSPVLLSLKCKVLVQDPGEAPTRAYQAVLTFEPGYTVRAVPVIRFVQADHAGRRFAVELAPAVAGEMPELAFGFLDVAELEGPPSPDVLVRDSPAVSQSGSTTPAIKCVVWDLDNTLWDGVLIEDGLSALRLRSEAVQVITELDRKGILQSVASKNDPEPAIEAIRHFGLAEFFLHPQVSWRPKSEAIGAIARALNLGTDTFALVDDQEFERAEVLAQHPQVLPIDPRHLVDAVAGKRFQVPVTAEAAVRRKYYLEEQQRSEALSTTSGSYEEFLRSCELEMRVYPLVEQDLGRAHELVQRTNQLNIATSRYTLHQLSQMLDPASGFRVHTIRARDRFGDYGLIGLCVLQEADALVRDLMFSCRIQEKLVDEYFVAWLDASRAADNKPLRARFSPTQRNTPARRLLEKTGFEQETTGPDGEIWIRRRQPRSLHDLAQLITLVTSEEPRS